MNKLNDDWLTQGLIDFEYKKYVLLSYLQTVKESFSDRRLYPFLGELVHHYNNLLLFEKNKQLMQGHFPKEVDGIDLNDFKLTYKQISEDSEIMSELKEIVEFAKPLLQSHLYEGKEIYEYVESQCELIPIGLMPLYTDEGYVFIKKTAKKKVKLFRYSIQVVHSGPDNFRAINTTYIDEVSKGVGTTYEGIKLELIRRFKELPNPATFLIQTKQSFPFASTIEPIAKRILVQYILKRA